MKRPVRRRATRGIFLALLALALQAAGAVPTFAGSACLDTNSGIGGTGRTTEGSGLGGTGAPLPRTESGNKALTEPGSGVGGTGVSAEGGGMGGTGIIGIITGFGSICVNGVEIHFSDGTSTNIDGEAAKVSDLALGQIVTVEATGQGTEVAARRISVIHAVTGPLSRLDMDRGQAEVLGQKIELTDHTVIATGARAQDLRVGDFVEISGLRRKDGTVVSSRLERAVSSTRVSVSGPVTEVEKDGFHIFGLHVQPANRGLPSEIAVGRNVQVGGTIDGTRLRSDHVQVAARRPFDGRIRRLELQGYIHDRPNDATLVIDGQRVELSDKTVIRDGNASELVRDRRVHVSAHITRDQRVLVERIGIEPRDHRLDIRHERGHRGGADDHRGRGGGSDRGDRSGPSRPDRQDQIDRSGPNRGSEMDRPDRVDRVDRYEAPERLDRSGPH